MRKVVNVVVAVTGGIGLVLLIFGLLVFSLFIQLTIASCKSDIELLQTLGISPGQLQKFLSKQLLPQNFAIIAVGVILVSVIQWSVSGLLKHQQIFLSPWISLQTALGGIIIFIVIWVVNSRTISKYIRK